MSAMPLASPVREHDPQPVAVAADDADVADLSSHAFDLATEPPLRAHLLVVSPVEQVLVMVLHHISSDGWSKAPLLRDLATGQVRALTEGFDRSVGSIEWARDGRSLLVRTRSADRFYMMLNQVVLDPMQWDDSKTWTDFSPSLGAEFRPNDDWLIYANWSRGFKSGTAEIGTRKAVPNSWQYTPKKSISPM